MLCMYISTQWGTNIFSSKFKCRPHFITKLCLFHSSILMFWGEWVTGGLQQAFRCPVSKGQDNNTLKLVCSGIEVEFYDRSLKRLILEFQNPQHMLLFIGWQQTPLKWCDPLTSFPEITAKISIPWWWHKGIEKLIWWLFAKGCKRLAIKWQMWPLANTL